MLGSQDVAAAWYRSHPSTCLWTSEMTRMGKVGAGILWLSRMCEFATKSWQRRDPGSGREIRVFDFSRIYI